MKTLALGALLGCAALVVLAAAPAQDRSSPDTKETRMGLGAFSVSLAVKDIKASQAFYGKLGFESIMGKAEQNWIILRNGTTTIGLFQGMFEDDILTFNPGWDAEAKPVKTFEDVRDLHARLRKGGLETLQEAGLDGDGPASFVLVDPDGNPVLFDQHVPKPTRDG
jgi:catechol 2,3-dioxygenase-like lactoylglutathione lyase family enzyme